MFCSCIYLYTEHSLRSLINTPPINDEVEYQRWNYFLNYYISGSFTPKLWEDDIKSYDQTLLGRYYYGYLLKKISTVDLSDYSREFYDVQQRTGRKDWENYVLGDWKRLKNASELFYKNTRTLRGINATISPVSVLLFAFIILLVTKSYFIASLWVILVLRNYNFIIFSFAVRNDWLFQIFLWLAVLVFLYALRNIQSNSYLWNWIVSGVAVGLSIAAKLTGVMIIPLIIVTLVVHMIIGIAHKLFIPRMRLFLGFTILFVSSYTTFFIFHPNIWRHPIAGPIKYIQVRNGFNTLDRESSRFTVSDSLASFNQYAFNIDYFYTDQLTRSSLLPIDIFLFCLGSLAFFIAGIKRIKSNGLLYVDFITLMFGWLCLNIIMAPNNWWQYYFTSLAPAIFFISFGVYVIIMYGQQLLSRIFNQLFLSFQRTN